MQNNTCNFPEMYTLERRFSELSECESSIKEIYNFWLFLKKDLIEKIKNISYTFSHYSNHDANHSKTIISNIEMFLGKERIQLLSPTDIFLLLICAYSHDYGMNISFGEITTILTTDSPEHTRLIDYLNKEKENEENENIEYIKIVLSCINKDCKDYKDCKGSKSSKGSNYNCNISLSDLYKSVSIVIQEYYRKEHSQNVDKIEKDYYALFENRLKRRITYSIIQICKSHSTDIKEIMKLPYLSKGLLSDNFHPRFIAAMLRLGDLLDLDNGRFDFNFVYSLINFPLTVPKISILHYKKHEAISHFLIAEDKIEVIANIKHDGSNDELNESNQVASLLADWINSLESDCSYLSLCWEKFIDKNFGLAPKLGEHSIYINDILYNKSEHNLGLNISHNRVIKLLIGTNIYESKYIGIREAIQNAVDASLLQLWSDLKKQTYENNNNKIDFNKNTTPFDLGEEKYKKYPIHIETGVENNKVYIKIRDYGIGIDVDNDLPFMTQIGSPKTENTNTNKIMKNMPNWLKPSGIFGIGLQSIFQMTHEIEFITKYEDRTIRRIKFHHPLKNKGMVEVERVYDKSHSQGTTVKFYIKNDFFRKTEDFIYIDKSFNYLDTDQNSLNDKNYNYYSEDINSIENEIKEAVISTLNTYFKKNYFIIEYNHVQNSIYTPVAGYKVNTIFYDTLLKNTRCSYNKNKMYNFFYKNKLRIWDSERNIRYGITIHQCYYDEKNQCYYVQDNIAYKDSMLAFYKFSSLKNIDSIFNANQFASYDSKNTDFDLYRCYFNIMDYKADDYINMNRDTLRESTRLSIDIIEDTIKNIFIQYCQYLLDDNNLSKLSEDNNPNKLDCGILISICLIFLKYIKTNLFDDFISKHQNILKNINFDFHDENILNFYEFCTVKKLLIKNNKWEKRDYLNLYFQVDKTNKMLSFDCDGMKHDILLDCDDSNLPINSLVPVEINTRFINKDKYDEYEMYYTCEFQMITEYTCVKLDYLSDLIYNLNVFEHLKSQIILIHENKLPYINYVFKPNDKFRPIVVKKKPNSFLSEKNFMNNLETNIKTYILSPFSIESIEYINENIYKEYISEEKFYNLVITNNQYKKCLEYAKKFNIDTDTNNSNIENISKTKAIEETYKKFINHFFNQITCKHEKLK